MNRMINHITDILWNLDKKQFNRIKWGVFACALFVLTGTLYLQWQRIHTTQKQMSSINEQRIEIKKILEQYEIIKKQQIRAKEIISEDKTFFLKQYFDDLIDKHHLPHPRSERVESKTSENLRTQGYQEDQLDATIENISMQELVTLLNDLEHKARIVIKKIDITKEKQQPTIDVSLIISTLTPATGASEGFEAE